MGVDFSFRNSFSNLGSFAKVSVPVKIYNSLVEQELNMDLCVHQADNSRVVLKIEQERKLL